MKGKYKVVVKNNRLHYEFEIKRNITIIRGDSATGKTTLINMLRQAENLGDSSGIEVVSKVPCRVLEGANWELILDNTEGTIFFIDEENVFITTERFAEKIRNSNNYFVLITGKIYTLCHTAWKRSTEFTVPGNIMIRKKHISSCIGSILIIRVCR